MFSIAINTQKRISKIETLKYFLSFLMCVSIPLMFAVHKLFPDFVSRIPADVKHYTVSIAIDFILAFVTTFKCYKEIHIKVKERSYPWTCLLFVLLILNNLAAFGEIPMFMLGKLILFLAVFVFLNKRNYPSLAICFIILLGIDLTFLLPAEYKSQILIPLVTALAIYALCVVINFVKQNPGSGIKCFWANLSNTVANTIVLFRTFCANIKKTGIKIYVKEKYNQFKISLAEFKQTKDARMIFMFCAIFPFFLSDYMLRYVISFIIIGDIKYYIVPILFNIFWIFGMTYFCYAILPEKIGKIVYAIIYLFFAIMFFVHYIYYCIFGQYMWIKAIFLAGEGMDYITEALPYIDGRVLVLAAGYILFLVATLYLWQKPVNKKKKSIKFLKCIVPFLLIIALHAGILVDTEMQISNGAWEIWDRPVLIYKNFKDSTKSLNMCGYYQFTFKSIYRAIVPSQQYTEEEVEECDDYFTEKIDINQNDMTGIFKDKNVIFVLMESMDDWLITEEYTPTIKYMMDNGINFENHYMPNMGSGYTFNSEFSMNTGFHCPTATSSSSVYTNNSFEYAMPNMFAKEGYNANSFHFNSETFYNRKVMHSKFGYAKYHCLMDYMPPDKYVLDSEVPLNDTVYGYMTEGKFFDFFISYSAHLPYNVIDTRIGGALEKYPELIDDTLDQETQVINILAHDTDQFFKNLIERLKADGLYENTVIIGVADHYAYGYKDREKLKQFSIDAGSEIMEKVPFFMFTPGMKPVKVTKVTGAIDIVPTITNLFGINSGYYLGNDAFDPNYSGYVYFSDGSWYDGNIHYLPGTDISVYGEENKQYIEEMNKNIIYLMKINDITVDADYFNMTEE